MTHQTIFRLTHKVAQLDPRPPHEELDNYQGPLAVYWMSRAVSNSKKLYLPSEYLHWGLRLIDRRPRNRWI